MKLYIILVLVLFVSNAFAAPAAIKNEDGTFKLSDHSINQMGIKFMKLNKANPWLIPSSALVKVKFTTGVYRRFEGDITFVIVKVLKTDGNSLLISSDDLEIGDEVAISGTNYLRLTEADLNSDTVDSCAH